MIKAMHKTVCLDGLKSLCSPPPQLW